MRGRGGRGGEGKVGEMGGRGRRKRKEGEIGGKVLREFSLCDVTRSISIKDREGGVNELIYRLPFRRRTRLAYFI